MAHFLKPNPTALRERKDPKDRQDLEGPPRPSVFPEPTRLHSRGTGTGMGKNQRRGICTIPHSEAKLGDKLRIPGTPGPKPVLVTHRPPPHSENTPGMCPGAGPQDRGPLPKSILRLYGTHGPFSVSPSYIPSLLRPPPPSVSLLLYMGHGLSGISDLCTFCSPGMEHPPNPILPSKFIPIL